MSTTITYVQPEYGYSGMQYKVVNNGLNNGLLKDTARPNYW